VVEAGLGERVGAVGVVAQLHDLALAQREDREQLPVELRAGELLAAWLRTPSTAWSSSTRHGAEHAELATWGRVTRGDPRLVG
jgi:hypothetical protein